MKFLADVNIPLPLILLIKKLGHEVHYATKEFPTEKDTKLIEIAKNNKMIILTRDKDFLELAKYPKYKTPLILISLTDQRTNNILDHIADLLNGQSADILESSITVIKEDKAFFSPLG